VAAAAERRWKPALLSALVLPGVGQVAQRRWLPATLQGLGSLALVVALLRRVYLEAHARLPPDPQELLDLLIAQPSWPLQLAREIQAENAGFFGWTIAGLLLLWAWSVADAWLASAPPQRRGSGSAKVG
jgi:hypothetical protein